jgi:hypothetical protein
MSIENHPNFHAVKFAANLVQLFYDCRRGDGLEVDLDDLGGPPILIKIVDDLETAIDRIVERRNEREA